MKVVLSLLLLLSFVAAAEELPSAPMPQVGTQAADHTVLPQKGVLQDSVQGFKSAGPEFWVSTGLLFASTIADEELAKAVEGSAQFRASCEPGELIIINHGGHGQVISVPCEAVGVYSPGLTTGDSRLKYYAFNLAADAAVTYLDYRLKNSNHRVVRQLWYAPAAFLTAFHVGYMFTNVEHVQ